MQYQNKGLAARIPLLALFFLATLALGAIAALCAFAFFDNGFQSALGLVNDRYILRVVRFTLWQAFLSTLLSVLFAIPVAIMFHEFRRFPGRATLLRIFALPLVLPQIVAVLAILSLYGNQGFLTAAFTELGFETGSIYGLGGILVAHVFFNMPLTVRIVLGALSSMPTEYDRLAHQLQLTWHSRFKLVYWPYMRPALFNASALVFMLCITSFTVVLTLGGGPRATTLEVAIYQALTFDFDIPRAVILTFLQLCLTAGAVFAFARAGGDVHAGMTLANARPMVSRRSLAQIVLSFALLAFAAFFVVSPFVAIVAKGIVADLPKLLGQSSVQGATLTSLVLGVFSASLCILVSLALCEGAVRHSRFGFIYSHAASLVLVVPPIVIAAGWFIILRPVVNVYEAAPFLVVSVNAAMALPFAMRFLLPSRFSAAERHDRLCAQLAIRGWAKFRLVLLPVMAKPIAVAFAFAFALSLGDLGVIALFGSEKVQTLPYLILQRMGSYRTDDAAGLAFLLCVLTMALMIYADRGSRTITSDGAQS